MPGFPDNSLAESLASPTARNRDGNWVNNGSNLPAADQERLLAISRDLTAIFRKRLAGQSPDGDRDYAPSRGMARALTRRRQPGTRA